MVRVKKRRRDRRGRRPFEEEPLLELPDVPLPKFDPVELVPFPHVPLLVIEPDAPSAREVRKAA